jgi:hypothetical protein
VRVCLCVFVSVYICIEVHVMENACYLAALNYNHRQLFNIIHCKTAKDPSINGKV